MEEAIKNKIIGLKAEAYDMIKQQESLSLQISQIQTAKLRKNQEIQELEEQYADNPVKDML
jgi:hypothetical protein